jgi:hemin uptake protein HemP
MSQPQAAVLSPAAAAPRSGDALALDSQQLFRHTREVLIQHNGAVYRLRLTRAGKLILTK